MSEHEQQISSFPGQAHRSWWVSFFRWLRRVLGFVWGTLLVGIVIGTLANLNTTTTDTPLAKLFIVYLTQTYPLAVWSSLSLLTALTLLSWLGSREKQPALAHPLSEQDRIHLLRRLRVRYEQLLAQSLQGAVQLELGLAARPVAVQNAMSLSLRLPDQPEYAFPPHTSIFQAYELAQQELLILGEPGAGKSTLLLELAHFLVEQAEQDETQPLPILLPLSSWAEQKRPLDEWLIKEVARLYDVPHRLSQQWLQAEQVIPLLDGLDEMEEAARPACIAAINAYHREHLRPLVVCSRSNEYDAATRHERLTLHAAVVVQLLEPRQVDDYLVNLGKPLAGLRAALKTNPLLQELATTPLMLQVLMLTYHDTSVQALPQQEKLLREHIWTDYVQRMVERKGDKSRYPLPVTIGRLKWLASEMRRHNQAIFSLESLQPDWLSGAPRTLFDWSVGLGIGLIGAVIGALGAVLIAAVIGALGTGLIGWLGFGLLFGLIIGLQVGLSFTQDAKIEPIEVLTGSWKEIRPLVPRLLMVGLGVGLITGVVVGLNQGLGAGIFAALSLGLGVVLFYGMCLLFFELSWKQLPEHLSPNVGIWRSARNGVLFGLVIGLLFGLVIGLLFGQGFGWVGGLAFGLLAGMLSMLGSGVGFGLLAFVQHFTLRFWLWRAGSLPWQAIPFLEDATTRVLLRRIGGGYSFIHRLLQDYLADQAEHTFPAPSSRTLSSS